MGCNHTMHWDPRAQRWTHCVYGVYDRCRTWEHTVSNMPELCGRCGRERGFWRHLAGYADSPEYHAFYEGTDVFLRQADNLLRSITASPVRTSERWYNLRDNLWAALKEAHKLGFDTGKAWRDYTEPAPEHNGIPDNDLHPRCG